MSSSVDSDNVIQYVPFCSFVSPAFWHVLTERKLNIDHLDASSKALCGRFTNMTEVRPVVNVDGTSFNNIPYSDHKFVNITGTIINKNTLEEFKSVDKKALLNSVGEIIWSDIVSKEWLKNPSNILKFLVLSFADLKKFHYYYWFAFPAPCQPKLYFHGSTTNIKTDFSGIMISRIQELYESLDAMQKPFFIILKKDHEIVLEEISKYLNKNVINQEINLSNTYFVFTDPSNDSNPGWPLRIFLAALIQSCPNLIGNTLKVIGLRTDITGSLDGSCIFIVKIPENLQVGESVEWVGWERNNKGKLGPQLADMSESMDPVKLADTSSNLNIKLMKWRLAPNLDVEIMKSVKCLLLGAGTLGCHVARTLLAWGFRHITFVDRGRVSYSNPCRQVLFTCADCLNGGKEKAQAAAYNLSLILPTVKSQGLSISIPMPGHPVGEATKAETINHVNKLTDAIKEHDVIFLLLDSREARWLPTLLGACFDKIVINAALGFDSCLIMRHGTYDAPEGRDSSPGNAHYLKGNKLGCYFCNDVTAPGNSMKDRTLDQQCTVTRPGISDIAGGLAVELLMALLQHPLRANAPAAYNLPDEIENGLTEELEGVLGPIPHSIRTFLHSYQMVLPTCPKFKHCIGCSDAVIDLYKSKGMDFLFAVFNSSAYLETVTGLHELHMSVQAMDIMDFSDDSDA